MLHVALALVILPSATVAVTTSTDDCTGNVPGTWSYAMANVGTNGTVNLGANAELCDGGVGAAIPNGTTFISTTVDMRRVTTASNLSINTGTLERVELVSTGGSITLTMMRLVAASVRAASAATMQGGSLDGSSAIEGDTVLLLDAQGPSGGTVSSTSGTIAVNNSTLTGATFRPHTDVNGYNSTRLTGCTFHMQHGGKVRNGGSGRFYAMNVLGTKDTWFGQTATTPVLTSVTVTGDATVRATGTYTATSSGQVDLYRLTANGFVPAGSAPITSSNTTFTIDGEGAATDTFFATLSAGSNTSQFTPNVTAVKGDVTFDGTSATVDEGAGSVTLTLERTVSIAAVTLPLVFTDGTATANADYDASALSAQFAKDAATTTVTIPILQDELAEGAETFTVGFGASGVLAGTDTFTVTIMDDDVATIAFERPTLPVPENAGTASITLNRNFTDGALDVPLTTQDGTATAGADYEAFDGIVSFADGETTATLTLTVLDDTQVEGDESFTVTAGAIADVVFGQTLTVTIVDDDTTPPEEPGTPEEPAPSEPTNTDDGGCAAVPMSTFAMLAATALLRRRK